MFRRTAIVLTLIWALGSIVFHAAGNLAQLFPGLAITAISIHVIITGRRRKT